MTPTPRSNPNPRRAVRTPWLIASACMIVTALIPVAAALGYTSKLICGKPTRHGRITVSLITMKDDGTFGYPKPVSLDVDSTWTAEEKAAFLRAEFWARVPLRDTLLALGTTPQIDFKGQNGWMIHSVNVIQDDSQEPDRVALGLPYPDQNALCSLSGTATGRDAHGHQAFVRLTAGQATITQPTQPGMLAEIVEQMLIAQLNQAGIAARFATAGDFAGCYQSLPHDGRVIWFPAPDTTGFREEITDVGLSLDIAAALDGSPQVPSSVPLDIAAPGLRLEVAPSIFSNGGVNVLFSRGSGAQDGGFHIDIYDVTGRRVRALSRGESTAEGTLYWDGRNENRASIPGGVYLVRLSTPQGNLVRRVVRVRD